MRTISRLMLISAWAVAAGGGDSGTGPEGSLQGTYTLRTINGSALPAIVVQVGSDRVEITGGSATINTGNTFSEAVTIRTTLGGSVTTESITCTGTYTQNGNSIAFIEAETEDCGANFNGTWSNGNTLTVAYDATVQAVYRK